MLNKTDQTDPLCPSSTEQPNLQLFEVKSCCACSEEQLSTSKPQTGGGSRHGAMLGKSREVLTRKQNPTTERDPTEPKAPAQEGVGEDVLTCFYLALPMEERSHAVTRPGRMQNKWQKKEDVSCLSVVVIRTKIRKNKLMQTHGETKGNWGNPHPHGGQPMKCATS